MKQVIYKTKMAEGSVEVVSRQGKPLGIKGEETTDGRVFCFTKGRRLS